jgi:hypothetical protein
MEGSGDGRCPRWRTVDRELEGRLFEKRAWKSALADDPAQSATVDFTMKRHWQGHWSASHHDMTATLSHSLKAMVRQQIAQLRTGEDPQFRHASRPAL